MAFEKGQSGNPSGRPKERPWRDAILRAIARKESKKDPKALEKLADKVVSLGLGGDMQALKEIGDRLDGKSVQQQVVTGDEEGGPVRFERIEIVVVDSPDTDA